MARRRIGINSTGQAAYCDPQPFIAHPFMALSGRKNPIPLLPEGACRGDT
jgi:hypothetical protein